MFTNNTKLGNNFHVKGRIRKDVTSDDVLSFGVDSAMNPIMVNELDTWI